MKELIKVFEKDIKSENFTRKEIIIYGIIAPIALILACGFAEWLSKFQGNGQPNQLATKK